MYFFLNKLFIFGARVFGPVVQLPCIIKIVFYLLNYKFKIFWMYVPARFFIRCRFHLNYKKYFDFCDR